MSLRPYELVSLMGGATAGGFGTQIGKDIQHVKCPVCDTRRRKTYELNRGIAMHLSKKHPDLSASDVAAILLSVRDQIVPPATRGGGANVEGREFKRRESVQESLSAGLRAAKDGDLRTLRELVADGWDVSSVDKHGSNALHWAAGSGHLETVQFLVETQNQDPLSSVQRGRRDGKTPLHWAARNGRDPVIQYLVEHLGVDVDCVTKDGSTPLHLALFGGHVTTAELLVSLGAQLSVKNNFLCGCDHWAAMGGHVEAIEWLWQRGSTFTDCQKEGQTPLHKAAAKRHLNALEFLLRKMMESNQHRDSLGQLVAVKDQSGFTAFQVARLVGLETARVDRVEELVDHHLSETQT